MAWVGKETSTERELSGTDLRIADAPLTARSATDDLGCDQNRLEGEGEIA